MTSPDGKAKDPPAWKDDTGAAVSCFEKIKVLNENFAELQQLAQDAFEDGLLMGCSETQLREAFRHLADTLVKPYTGKFSG